MQTDDSRGAPSGTRPSNWTRGLVLAAGALLCVAAAPVMALGAAPATPTALPTPSPPAAAHLALSQTVDRKTAAAGDSVTYTISLSNTGGLAATGVTVTDVLAGTAAYLVADGTGGTTNTFAGEPVVTITRVLTGHYEWSYPLVAPGATDIVKFSAAIMPPRGSQPPGTRTITLTSTASSPGVAPAAVTTTAPLTPHGAGTRVPATGSEVNAAVAGFLLLGGLGLILLAVYARERDLAR